MADRGSSKVLIALLVVHTTLLPRVVGLQPAGSAGTASGMGYDGDAACNSANGGGTCVLPSGPATPAHYCLCNAGFSDYQCETDISGTVSGLGACTGSVACNSANGGGSCATFPVNYCVCTAGFTGNQCQTSPQASPSTSPSPRGPSGSPSPSISPSPTSPSIIPYTMVSCQSATRATGVHRKKDTHGDGCSSSDPTPAIQKRSGT